MYRRANLFYRVVDALFRNQKLVLTTMICVAVPVALLLMVRSTGFMASGAIRIAKENEPARLTAGGDIENLGFKLPSEVHVSNLTTLLLDTKEGGFVDHVVQRAALNTPLKIDPAMSDKRLETFRNNLSVKKDQDNLFSVTLNWEDSGECQRLVKAVLDQYIDEQVKGKQQASQNAAEFLKKQIDEIQAKVDSAARALQNFQQLHPTVGPDQQQQTIDYIMGLKDRLRRARVAAQEGSRRSSTLTPLRRMPRDTEETPVPGASAPSASEHRLEDLQSQRARLMTGESAFRTDSEPVRALDRQIAQVRQDITKERRKKAGNKRSVNPIFERLMNEANDASAYSEGSALEVRELEAQLAEEEKKLGTIPAIRRQADSLIENLQAQQAALTKTRERYNEALQKANLEREQASQLLQPVGDVFPISLSGPKKKVTLGLMSLLIGAIVAGLMVAVREWNDPTLRYETDIEQFLDVPVLTGLTETRAILAPKASAGRRSKEKRR